MAEALAGVNVGGDEARPRDKNNAHGEHNECYVSGTSYEPHVASLT